MFIGLCVCGSFCTLKNTIAVTKRLVELGHDVQPIFSYSVASMDTRFYKAVDFCNDIKLITGKDPITTIIEAEPIGPKKYLDILLVLPTTGNTLAKLAHSITDTPVTMAVKAHIRNLRPVVLSIATNDGLSGSANNIATLLNKKHYYFVPFGQDDPLNKPNSLIANTNLIELTLENAIEGNQIQPLIF